MHSDYLVEYRTNGIPKVFEFYLFVNPLGKPCYCCEQELQKIVACISSRTDIHVICYHNQYIVSEFMRQLNISTYDLSLRNQIYQSIYLASIAFKAASMQGKKRGRRFLMAMQSRIDGHLERFSESFIMDLAEEIGLDIPTFIDDLNSDYAKHLLIKDQQIAHDMNVNSTPALVIFEHRLGKKGLLLNGMFSAHNILTHLNQLVEQDYLAEHDKPVLTLL